MSWFRQKKTEVKPKSRQSKKVKGFKATYTDKDAGLYITSQGEVIDRCRALLGNKSRLK